METFKKTANSFTLASTWTVYRRPLAYDAETGQRDVGLAYRDAPSTGERTVSFEYTLPTGAKIKSSSVWATVGKPLTGIGSLRANGISMNKKSGAERGADVSLNSISGTLSVKFTFRAQGSLDAVGTKTARLPFQNVYLWIEYEMTKSSGSSSGTSSGSGSSTTITPSTTSFQGGGIASGAFPSPPQNVCIIDQENQHVYLFDAVTKEQHGISVDIQEEPSKKKELYVNNARNAPDKLSLNAVISDVHTGAGDIYNDAGGFTAAQKSAFELTKNILADPYLHSRTWSRSQNAYYTMYNLKYNRKKLSVVTPHYVYTDMLIESITATHDNTCPYGIIMQIELKGAFDVGKKKDNTSSVAASTEDTGTPAFIANDSLSGFASWFSGLFGG